MYTKCKHMCNNRLIMTLKGHADISKCRILLVSLYLLQLIRDPEEAIHLTTCMHTQTYVSPRELGQRGQTRSSVSRRGHAPHPPHAHKWLMNTITWAVQLHVQVYDYKSCTHTCACHVNVMYVYMYICTYVHVDAYLITFT